MAMNRASSRVPVGVPIVAALFWSAVTLLFDVHLGWGALHQLYALSYPVTPGIVTHSESECISSDEGGSYRPKIKYTYVVAGKEYQGDRLHYGQMTHGPRTTQRIVDAYPVGKPVDVHYASRDPADSVLNAGWEGIDLFFAMFMLPFNLIMTGFWVAGGRWINRRFRQPSAGGARVRQAGNRLMVRLSSWRPLYSGPVVAGALAFAGVFIVSFGISTNPSMQVMSIAWAVILGGASSAYLWHAMKWRRGRSHLAIDTLGHCLTLPATHGRRKAVTVLASQIIAIEVDEIKQRDADEGFWYRYAPTLVFTGQDGSTRRERLVDWSNKARAEEFAAWLCERLHVDDPIDPLTDKQR